MTQKYGYLDICDAGQVAIWISVMHDEWLFGYL